MKLNKKKLPKAGAKKTRRSAKQPRVEPAVPRVPTLIGISGYFKGMIFPLRPGKAITVGRSRTADVSMRRTQPYRSLAGKNLPPDDAALTVSGKHFQVTVTNSQAVEVKNLSPNGTQLDGKPVDKALLKDVENRPHEIRFGVKEVLRLEMRNVDE